MVILVSKDFESEKRKKYKIERNLEKMYRRPVRSKTESIGKKMGQLHFFHQLSRLFLGILSGLGY